MTRNTKGTDLRNRVLLEVTRRWPDRFRLWAQNVGAVKIDQAFVRFGPPGLSDIIGIIGPHGRMVCIEIKAGNDRMSDIQNSFRDMVLKMGGVHIIGRSVEQVMAELEQIVGAL